MEHADMFVQYPKLAQAFVDEPNSFPHILAERHPRVCSKINELWGTFDGVRELDSCLLADRPDRQGFSFDVIRELFLLKEMHDALFPHFLLSSNDPFSTAAAEVTRADVESRRESARKGEKGESNRQSHTIEKSLFEPLKPASAPVQTATKEIAKEDSVVEKAASKWPMVRSIEELHGIMLRRAKGERVPERDTRQLLTILKDKAGLAEQDIESAIKIQSGTGKKKDPIGKVLLTMGAVDDQSVTRALCMQYGVVMVDLRKFKIPFDTQKLISMEDIHKFLAVPIANIDGVLFVAVENPFSFDQREYLGFKTQFKIELVMSPVAQITQCIANFGQVRSVKQGDQEFRNLARQALADTPEIISFGEEKEDEKGDFISQDDATIVTLVNKIISDAAEVGASDIHIESYPGDPLAYIRFRRDGRMENYSQYSASYHRAVISRIKIMSSLNIAERRLPQDGKISFRRGDKLNMDLRIATIPTVRGIENVAIRLLHAGEPIPIEKIGMGERDQEVFRRMFLKPHGLILVCGPTGSGKTTTLHSVLQELNTPDRKIWTAEDPIEIVQKNICQVQMHSQIGWTFARALRAFLRADPDVIMIGEMRDVETAKIAVEASMTGHLVLSTLHTNSASETAARLLDLEVDSFNLADALVGVLAQRLVRGLCQECATLHEVTTAEIDDLALEYYKSAYQKTPSLKEKEVIIGAWMGRYAKDGKLYLRQAKGCEQCDMEGYRKRLPLFELMEVTPEVRELIAHGSPASAYQSVAVSQGMRTLRQDGIEKALQGRTDMLQVHSVCS